MRWGTSEAQQRYERAIAEWLSNGRRSPIGDREIITVAVLVDRFRSHAATYYVKHDGTPTTEQDNFDRAIAPLLALYADMPVAEFGPRHLRAVRQRMLETGWSRTWINAQVARVRQVFKWGTSHELVPSGVYPALQAVAGLKRGRSAAPEKDPVRPAPEAHVEAVRACVSATIRDMIDVQLLTGCRPDELCRMRAIDIDRSGPVWEYRPAGHKGSHHGHERVIFIGPAAQAIIQRRLSRQATTPLFPPREGHGEARAADAHARRRPNQQPTPRRTQRRIRTAYTTDTYRRAIHRACDKAAVPRWSPGRLRHNAASRLRAEHGIDVAQTILGHRLGSTVTEVYAEANVAKAKDVIGKVG